MSRIRQWILLACLLLPSLACSGTGIWMMYESALQGNRLHGRIGFYLLFGGMTVVPVGLAILGNLVLRGERIRFRQAKRFPQETAVRQKIRTRASISRLKKRPVFVLSFCVMGLLVGVTMLGLGLFGTEGEHGRQTPQEKTKLLIMGGGCAAFYACAVTFCLVKIVKKQWNSYFDLLITKLDLKIKSLEENQTKLKSLAAPGGGMNPKT